MTKSLLFQNLIYKKLLKLITDLINKLYKFFFYSFYLILRHYYKTKMVFSISKKKI